MEYVPIIVNATTPSLELANHAADVGASTISSLPPIHHKPGLKSIVNHFSYLSKIDLPISYVIIHRIGI